MYSITVRPRLLNGTTITIISVEKQLPKGALAQFSCSLHLEEGHLKVFGSPKLSKENDLWNKWNFIVIAKCLFMFFARTKHACSREWTEGWYMSGSPGAYTYKMYDCSLMFMASNVSLETKLMV